MQMTPKIVNEYDQEIPQSQTAANPVAPIKRDNADLNKLITGIGTSVDSFLTDFREE